MFREQDHNPDHYAQQKSLFGDEPAAPHPKGFREELHAREKDNIPNPNRHPGQFAPKGGSNPLLKVVEHEHGWTASTVLKDGKEFRVEGRDRREAIGNAVRAGEKMGVIFDPPKAEPAIGGLFGGSFDEKAHPRHKAGDSDGGQFAAKNDAEDAPFALQQPKRKPAAMSFDNNANTKQAALFDSGKKKELPGQELLFNSDAGDLHNPKTMENKTRNVAPQSLKIGDRVDVPASHTSGAFSGTISTKGKETGIKVEGSDYLQGHNIPLDRMSQWLDELNGKISHPEGSNHPSVDRVVSGKGKYLGRGQGGMAFDSGDGKIVKASAITPFHWNNGVRSQQEANLKLKSEIDVANKLHGLGIPGMMKVGEVSHDGRLFAIRDKVDLDRPMTQHAINQAGKSLEMMHSNGFIMKDEVQIGIGRDGEPVFFDVGEAGPNDNPNKSWAKEDRDGDHSSLKRFAEKNGLTYRAPREREAYPRYEAVMSKIKKAEASGDSKELGSLRMELRSAWSMMKGSDPELREMLEDEYKEALAKVSGTQPDSFYKPEVASSESKSQPDPKAIAQEALSNNENIGITMGRHGVTIKGHPDYRTIRQQVSEHLAELQEQAKPQPSAARQRAMDSQIQNRLANPADNYSSRVYQQFEHETERYLRDYTLYDVDRYGVGGNIMKMILSMVAMHAMSSMMGSGTSSPRKPAAQKQAPSNQDFEKLHPRAQTQAGNSKPGQFAKKPEGAAPAPAQRQVRPLTERPDMGSKPRQAPPQQQQPQTPPVEPSALETPEVPPVEAKPWIAEPNPSRGTPEQKAAQLQQRIARDQAAAQPPVQQPKDANTARIAEIWDVDTTQPGPQSFDVWHSPKTGSNPAFSGAASAGLGDVFATDNKDYAAQYGTPGQYTATMQNPYQMSSGEFRSLDRSPDASFQKSVQFRKELESKGHDGIVVSHADGTKEHVLFNKDGLQPKAPRNYPDNLNKPPEQQQDYAPPAHSLEGFTAQVMNNLKTPANEQDNPRKKFLLNGTPNPGYAPQDISGPERPAKIRKRAVKPAAEPTAESEPSAPSLLDMPSQSGDGGIFENPAAKARKEKAELDRVAKLEKEELARITHFDPNDFAEDGDEEEEFAEGEQFSELPPTEEQYNTPEHLQAAIDYRARRPASEDPQELAAWRKTKPETFESALKKWKARRSRHKTKTEKNIHQGDPRENIAEVAKENEFDPDSFGEYIGGMEAQEKQQWKRREKLKSDILKTWHKTSSELRDLENRKGGDAASLRGVDSLKGNLDDDQLYEFLGSDDSNWVQNAWDMVREEPPAEPGPHNREWLESHVKNFKREQSNVYQPEEYDQPEDDMPFSRRALVKSVDRYFRDARQSFRSRRSQKDSGFWTLLDAYL